LVELVLQVNRGWNTFPVSVFLLFDFDARIQSTHEEEDMRLFRLTCHVISGPPSLRSRLVLGALLAVFALLTACGGPNPTTPSGSENFILPVRLSQIDDSAEMKIWPYGVPGGDHPHGHPGIDFTLIVGADILADQDGKVTAVSASVYPGEIGITIRHDGGWSSYLTGFYQTVNVTEGERVVQWQVVGTIDHFGDPSAPASIHWGIVNRDRTAFCPADFVSSDLRAQLQQLLDQSQYLEKVQYPLLCNPCPADGCR
jgi:hypothetical protein